MTTRRGPSLVSTATLASLLSLSFSLAPSAMAEDAPASSASPPPLTLTVTPAKGGGPWKLRVENTGELPVRISADARLLTLEVTPPATAAAAETAKKPRGGRPADPTVQCSLPRDVRPQMDGGYDLVVPAKRAWSQSFDPHFYCFGARERAALVTGATVKARFGWPAPPAKAVTGRAAKSAPAVAPPFVASPVGAAVGKISPAKEIESAPFTLTEDVPRATSAASTSNGATDAAEAPAPLTVTVPDAHDVSRGVEIATTVTVKNDGERPLVMLLRPDMFRFTVGGPGGSVACGSTRQIASPIRELYSTLAPKGRASISVLLSALCPPGTFDDPGVYRVTPVLDTSGASGKSVGLRTWDGVATGKTPMLLRVRTERRPSETPSRPALE